MSARNRYKIFFVKYMVDGVILVHGMIAQCLVVGPNIVGIACVIILHHNMAETIVRSTDRRILRLKSVMRIHAPVSLNIRMIFTMIVCPSYVLNFPIFYSKRGMG